MGQPFAGPSALIEHQQRVPRSGAGLADARVHGCNWGHDGNIVRDGACAPRDSRATERIAEGTRPRPRRRQPFRPWQRARRAASGAVADPRHRGRAVHAHVLVPDDAGPRLPAAGCPRREHQRAATSARAGAASPGVRTAAGCSGERARCSQRNDLGGDAGQRQLVAVGNRSRRRCDDSDDRRQLPAAKYVCESDQPGVVRHIWRSADRRPGFYRRRSEWIDEGRDSQRSLRAEVHGRAEPDRAAASTDGISGTAGSRASRLSATSPMRCIACCGTPYLQRCTFRSLSIQNHHRSFR